MFSNMLMGLWMEYYISNSCKQHNQNVLLVNARNIGVHVIVVKFLKPEHCLNKFVCVAVFILVLYGLEA